MVGALWLEASLERKKGHTTTKAFSDVGVFLAIRAHKHLAKIPASLAAKMVCTIKGNLLNSLMFLCLPKELLLVGM